LLGYFDDDREAAKVCHEAATRLHGEFARINVIATSPGDCYQFATKTAGSTLVEKKKPP